MKTKLLIEIETPDDFALQIEPGEEYAYDNGQAFAQDWHKELVGFIQNIADHIENDLNGCEFEEFYDHDGELPERRIVVEKRKEND